MLIVVTSESKEHEGRCPGGQFAQCGGSILVWKFEVSEDNALAQPSLSYCHAWTVNSGCLRPGPRLLLARPSATYPMAGPELRLGFPPG